MDGELEIEEKEWKIRTSWKRKKSRSGNDSCKGLRDPLNCSATVAKAGWASDSRRKIITWLKYYRIHEREEQATLPSWGRLLSRADLWAKLWVFTRSLWRGTMGMGRDGDHCTLCAPLHKWVSQAPFCFSFRMGAKTENKWLEAGKAQY